MKTNKNAENIKDIKINVDVDEIEEEDWSNEMTFNNHGGRGNYANHDDVVKIPLGSARYSRIMKIHSVQSLTPLDMMALYNGNYDATGNRIWMAAHFFVKLFAYDYLSIYYREHHSDNLEKDVTTALHPVWKKLEFLRQLRRKLFHKNRVLELGCGTGCSGISLLLQPTAEKRDHFTTKMNMEHISFDPSCVTFSDSDLGSLDLCEKNILNNNIDTNLKQINVYQLIWEEDDVSSSNSITKQSGAIIEAPAKVKEPGHIDRDESTDKKISNYPNLHPKSYHTIIATDVIYDISAIRPLLCTASRFIQPNGYFILAHVPRAYLPSKMNEKEPKSMGTGKIKNNESEKKSKHFLSDGKHTVKVYSGLSPLERMLVSEAQMVGFELGNWNESGIMHQHVNKESNSNCLPSNFDNGIIRPLDIKDIGSLCNLDDVKEEEYSLQEMQDAGSCIFVFRKIDNQ